MSQDPLYYWISKFESGRKEMKMQHYVGDLKNRDSQLEKESWWDKKL